MAAATVVAGAAGYAMQLIEAMSEDWDPESYTDCYRKRLQKVVEFRFTQASRLRLSGHAGAAGAQEVEPLEADEVAGGQQRVIRPR